MDLMNSFWEALRAIESEVKTVTPQADSQSKSSSVDGISATPGEQEARDCEPEPENQGSPPGKPAKGSQADENEDTPMQQGESDTRLPPDDQPGPDDRQDRPVADEQVRVEAAMAESGEAVAHPQQMPSTGAEASVYDTSQNSSTIDTSSTPTSTHTRLTSPDATSASDSSPEFALLTSDIGEGLVEKLQDIVTRDGFNNEIHITISPTDPTKLDTKDVDCQFSASVFEPGPEGEGWAFAYVSKRRSLFKWLDFSSNQKIPTAKEVRN
ncbi:hypothetical protein QQZ08_009229 [Neonectria magnoliae]|uniref:Uncharacterized protein n=1 Tax=Neonectria magnoliae TaxID=2732573 RepID=A0ABR1HQH8_9HYPO